MNIAVFGVDPGGATGLAWGVFNPHEKDIGDQLRNRMLDGSVTIDGEAREQITKIGALWGSFFRTTVENALLPPERVWLVVENFIYSGKNNYSGESAMISTAIIWGLEGYRMGRRDEWLDRPGRNKDSRKAVMPNMILQPAGDAKNFAKPERLKEWNCWVVGRDHERSAWQHIAFFLKRYQAQGLT